MSNLTDRQASFVSHYLAGGSATAAAVSAGFSSRSARQIATRLMSKASIRAAIAERQGVDAKRLRIDRQRVIQTFVAAFELAREQRNPAAMISAMREVGRMLGMYSVVEHKVEVSHGGRDEAARFETMSDAELIAVTAGQG